MLDCGEGKPDYLPHLEESLKYTHPEAYISDIIISHGHMDHWGGLNDILDSSTLNSDKTIQVHKFPIPDGCHVHHFEDFPSNVSVSALIDKQVFQAEDTTLKVIYTPGHTKDHCTFWLEEEQSIFTADCILGQGTAVFDDLSEYIEGLQNLITFNPKQLYPGHGPVIENGIEKIKEYVNHRMERENQIVELLTNGTKESWTPTEIVEVLYKGYPESLHMHAARGIVLHLLKLQKDGKVTTPESLAFVEENLQQILNAKWYWNTQPQKNNL